VGLRIGGEIASGAAASVDGVRLAHFRPEILGLDDAQVRRVFPYKWKEHTVRDTEKARVQLGYREAVGLEEGLKRSLAWYLEGGRESLGPRADYRLEDTLLARLGG
jgi:nucleoside-diphosphate-sugar epimerase